MIKTFIATMFLTTACVPKTTPKTKLLKEFKEDAINFEGTPQAEVLIDLQHEQ